MKTMRVLFTTGILLLSLAGCAGVDLDEFIAALESENMNADPAAAQTDKPAEEAPVVETPGSSVFAERIPVQFDDSRTIEVEPYDTGFEPVALSVIDALHAWVVGDDGAVARTEDGGRTWQDVEIPGFTNRLEAVSFYDRRHGIIADTNLTVAITSDGGDTWAVETLERRARIPEDAFWYSSVETENGVPTRTHFHAAHAHGPRTFMVGGSFGTFFLYHNGEWEERTMISSQTIYGIDSVSDGTILVATGIGLADAFEIARSSLLNPEWESIVNFTGPPALGVHVSENGRLIAQGSAIMGDSYGDSTFSASSRMQLGDMQESISRRWGPGAIRDDAGWVFLNPAASGSSGEYGTLDLLYSDDGGDSWVVFSSSIEMGLAEAEFFEPGHALGIASTPGTWNRELVGLRW